MFMLCSLVLALVYGLLVIFDINSCYRDRAKLVCSCPFHEMYLIVIETEPSCLFLSIS